ncbi:glutathione hydrolase 1 proenzyme-like isoform X2 [Babylonia areolata]|uniref:glutathione hydrolase 1 proenzyme-like isoform X2 n=1 Tax=Babylonia areolata TaxID=304850 RepID=UPI003FD59E1E
MTETEQKVPGDVMMPAVSNDVDASCEGGGAKADHTAIVMSGQGTAVSDSASSDSRERGVSGKADSGRYLCCPCSKLVVCSAVGVMITVYLLALGLGLGLGLGAAPRGAGQGGRRPVGAVAADHTACSEVGRDILAEGGSAVDSAVATLLCVGVLQPHSMGIGGGVFLVVYDRKTGTVDTYDGREVAPLAATFDRYVNNSFTFGKWSIGVPGEIPAYWKAHQKHGRLPWKKLFAPAIDMAANGHPLSYSAARALRVLRDVFGKRLKDYPDLCQVFCKANSTEPKEEGDTVWMPALADTLRGLAAHGPDFLYSNTSTAARNFVRDVQSLGGLVTMEDLQRYRVVQDPPLTVSLGDLTLHTMTAPSGGPVLALLAKILHDLNLSPSDLSDSSREAAMWHKVVEAIKFAYADRLHLGDPAFVHVSQLLQKMASPDYARKLRQAIDPTRTYESAHYTNITSALPQEEGTTHISVLGPDGDAVSATSTINYYYGSLLMSPSTGIILNNELADFNTAMARPGLDLTTLQHSSPNFIQPGKRPLSSMAPAIVVDRAGNPRLVVGSAGGARITNCNVQVMARVLWLGQTLKEAILAKRLHHQLVPNVLKWEFGYPQDVLTNLASYGHTLKERTTYMAVAQAVSRDPVTGQVSAFSDPRKKALARLLFDTDMK